MKALSSAESAMTVSFEFRVPAYSSRCMESVTKRESGTVKVRRVSRVPPSKGTILRHMLLHEGSLWMDSALPLSLALITHFRKQVH